MNSQQIERKRRPRRKRCRHCDALFDSDPRVGKRQLYCSRPGCQRSRKRTYQRMYRERHPDEEVGRRLRAQLATVNDRSPPPRLRPADPLGRVPWEEVRQELGAKVEVVLVCALRVVVRWLIRSHPLAQEISGKVAT